jgi:hypothetical protein
LVPIAVKLTENKAKFAYTNLIQSVKAQSCGQFWHKYPVIHRKTRT